MMKVFHKTQKEIEDEKMKYNFGAHLAKGKPFQVCPTYVKNLNGDKVDTWALSITELFTICCKDHKLDILNYIQHGEYCPYPNQTISNYSTLKDVLNLVNKENFGIALDFIGSIDKHKLYEKASIIAQYNKEIRGEQSSTRDVVNEFAKHEKNKYATSNKSLK